LLIGLNSEFPTATTSASKITAESELNFSLAYSGLNISRDTASEDITGPALIFEHVLWHGFIVHGRAHTTLRLYLLLYPFLYHTKK
jgi:hypothetical protein